MEQIRERELGIVGERYGSFLEAYRVNDRRGLNAACKSRGDGGASALFEADDGIVFTPEETRHALLYGSGLYSGRYKEMRKRVRKTLQERYEWMEEDRFGADVRGEHVIMERYAIGHPEAFHRKRATVRQERSVEIFYDAMCPASTPVAKRIEAGCVVASCADALERIGYKVALTFCLATYDGNSMSDDPTLLLEVALKGYRDALNVKKLEFPLAAKPVLFHLGVWWAHRFPQTPGDFGEGEGYPVSYDARRVRALERYAKERHGAYLSEDLIEMQLSMDPTRTLERILGAIGEAEVLEEHMAGKATMQTGQSPRQGKLFGGSRRPEDPDKREAPGEGGERGAAPEERPGEGSAREGSGRRRPDAPRESPSPSPAPRPVPQQVPGSAAGSEDCSGGPADEAASGGRGEVGETGDDLSSADNGSQAGEQGRDGASDGVQAPDASARTDEEPEGASATGRRSAGSSSAGPRDTGNAQVDGDAPSGPAGPAGASDAEAAQGGAGEGEDGRSTPSEGGDASAGRQPQDTPAQDAPGAAGAAPGGQSAGDGGAQAPNGATEGAQSAPSEGAGGNTASADSEGASNASSGSGASSPSSSGAGESQGGGGSGKEREDEAPEQDEDADEEDADEQGESMDESTEESSEERDQQAPRDQEQEGREDAEEPERDSFIVELRKRYVRFERGDYRRMKEAELHEAQAAASATTGRGTVKAPPIKAVTGSDDYEFGTPRSTPFSVTYVPKRKS